MAAWKKSGHSNRESIAMTRAKEPGVTENEGKALVIRNWKGGDLFDAFCNWLKSLKEACFTGGRRGRIRDHNRQNAATYARRRGSNFPRGRERHEGDERK